MTAFEDERGTLYELKDLRAVQHVEKIDRTWCAFFKNRRPYLNHSITVQERHKFT